MSTTDLKLLARIRLIDVLRDRSKWPEGFIWNYSNCRTCAMGLAMRMGMLLEDDISPDGLANKFGISRDDAVYVFGRLHLSKLKVMEAITPEDVADALEELNAKAIA